MNKFNIGVISERYQNDGEPVAYLLEQYFPAQAEYTQIWTEFKGSQLGNKKFFRSLPAIFLDENLDFIVIIKDLDNDDNREDIKVFFNECTERLEGNNVNICFEYMIEALAMADLDTVCKHYKKNIKKIKIDTTVRDAKTELKIVFGYTESDINHLVKKFDKQVLKDNYLIWADFITDFDKKLTYFIMR